MTDMTPDSPVSLLWPDGAGGLTGARAQKRLASAGIATVGQLHGMTGMTADDILAIPRSAKGVLAETRRALTANGLHLALDPAPSPASQREAREAGQAAAQRAGRRERARREDDPPVTAEDFAALAGELRKELAEADPEKRRKMLAIPREATPRSFRRRSWVWDVLGPDGAARLTGYSASTIRAYAVRSRRAFAAGVPVETAHRVMPPRHGSGWAAGDLALWIATRNEKQAAGYAAGPKSQRDQRRRAEILPEVAGAMNAILLRGEKLTYSGLAREMGVDYHTAVDRADLAGVKSELRQDRAARAAAAAVRERWGHVTFSALAAELGIEYEEAVAFAARTRIRSALEEEQAADERVSAFISAHLAETRRYQANSVLLRTLHAAGIPASADQVSRLAPAARTAEARRIHQPTGTELARGESLHPQGWLYATQVARLWGVSPGAITSAVKRGDIRVVNRSHGRTWIDPARLRGRADNIRTPVDKDHPKARPETGEG